MYTFLVLGWTSFAFSALSLHCIYSARCQEHFSCPFWHFLAAHPWLKSSIFHHVLRVLYWIEIWSMWRPFDYSELIVMFRMFKKDQTKIFHFSFFLILVSCCELWPQFPVLNQDSSGTRSPSVSGWPVVLSEMLFFFFFLVTFTFLLAPSRLAFLFWPAKHFHPENCCLPFSDHLLSIRWRWLLSWPCLHAWMR